MDKVKIFAKIKEISFLAKWALLSILSLFVISRVMVVLIMMKWLPSSFFFNIGGAHIHHYVYGIFLIFALCTYLLFRQHMPVRKERLITALIYGAGMTLLFDEFVMWLTLDSSNYYNKISVDAIIMIIVLLIMTWLLPKLKKIGVDTWKEYIMMWVIAVGIGLAAIFILADVYGYLKPFIDQLNNQSPK
jgi:small-conductance mechanosensitive channel